MAEEMLTLPKFEEASEIVKKVTQETNWFTANISASRREIKST